MTPTPSIPLNLRAAKRSVRDVGGLEPLSDWQWYDPQRVWAFRCRLTVDTPAGGPVPFSTEWYVTATRDYPWGKVRLYPAKQRGLAATFQHQNYNHLDIDDPWRWGDPCLQTPLHVLGRHGFDGEPYGASGPSSRLRWNILRALDWLRAASRGQLAMPGDRFEIPQFFGAVASKEVVAFAEDAGTFAVWQGIGPNYGLVELMRIDTNRSHLVVRSFLDARGENELLTLPWGPGLCHPNAACEIGVWMRLPGPPVLPPWQAPLTWHEFRTACRRQKVPFDDMLREASWILKDCEPHLLLLGFPFPARIGGPDAQLHWQAAKLRAVASSTGEYPGFRTGGAQARWREVKTKVTGSSHRIAWVNSQNWNPGQLVARGRLAMEVAMKKVLLVGGGALGSAVAELLLRAGTYEITVIDGEKLAAGNLCRHTLCVPDLGKNKAEGLAKRLAEASPHAVAVAVADAFPPGEADDLAKVHACDLVIDCTAEDDVVHALSTFQWVGTRPFASFSLGYAARRLFCFVGEGPAFPLSDFRTTLRPWLEREQAETGDEELPPEGLGCWNPIFPARIDDVWMMAAVAVKQLESALLSRPVAAELSVFEQRRDETGFTGVAKVTSDASHGGSAVLVARPAVRPPDTRNGTRADAPALPEGERE